MKTRETNVWKGLIIECIKEMRALAGRGNFVAKQNLNSVTVLVAGDSDADLIFRDQQRAQSGLLGVGGVVGPYPATELTAEELANDDRIRQEQAARREKEDAERRVIQEQKEREFFAELEACPAMDRDEAKWREGIAAQNGAPYGLCVFTFAEYWARLMQKKMDEGHSLEAVAEECSSKADIPCGGITGFMYGCAVSILAQCWKHGEELRVWHNRKYQIKDEGDRANESGGVINPAILCVD